MDSPYDPTRISLRVTPLADVPPGQLLLNGLSAVEDLLRDAGISVHQSSRFAKNASFIREIAARDPGDLVVEFATASKLAQAAADLQDAKLIVEALAPQPQWRPLISMFTDGTVLPGDDRNGAARNRQFELLAAALLQKGGFAPEPQEPDIVFTHDGVRLALAAKRVGSVEAGKKRLNEAARQIRTHGVPGIIVMEASRAMFPKDLLSCSASESEMRTLNALLFDEMVAQPLAKHVNRLDPRWVIGVVLFATFKGIDKSRGCPVVMWRRITLSPRGKNEPRLVAHRPVFQALYGCAATESAKFSLYGSP